MNKHNFQFKNLQSKFLVNSTHRLLRRHLPYKGRQTPLTPLHRGDLEELHKGGLKWIYSGALEVSAFSLIELSIVLIIIGLLVAGVTGGKSLIESAKIRAFANELEGWKRDVYTFKAARDRFPGDRDNLGKFGCYSGYTYLKTDFDEPYRSGTFVPNEITAPYVELFTEGISDFKPTQNSAINSIDSEAPLSNAFKKFSCKYYYKNSSVSVGNTYFSGINEGNILIRCNTLDSSPENKVENIKKLDLKLDDGKHNSGIIRGYCKGNNSEGSNSYDSASSCWLFYYDMKLN